ncbi:MAG TPA: CDP-alcohol phosphatidyltransferase family protein, partial [archaeon]|nr:CDP-alcohol phosphatidyltransferase family protein [archaeon]
MVAKGKAKAVAEPGFWNIANQVTLFRVFMVFAALYLASLQGAFLLNLFGVALIPLAFALDAVDGFIARKFGAATRFGSFFDVFGDRVTELTLWIFFLSTNAVPFWAVLVVVLRGLATDAVRAEALSKGKTVYGMMESGAGKAFVSSRFMR